MALILSLEVIPQQMMCTVLGHNSVPTSMKNTRVINAAAVKILKGKGCTEFNSLTSGNDEVPNFSCSVLVIVTFLFVSIIS